MAAPEHPEPLLRVVRGTPSPEEVAALVGVLLAGSRPAADPPAPSTWLTTARPGVVTPAGMPARPGPDEWRRSALPR